MKQFEARFKHVDVFPMVKHFMDQLDLFNLLSKYVPAASDSLADHAESLCILTAYCPKRRLLYHHRPQGSKGSQSVSQTVKNR